MSRNYNQMDLNKGCETVKSLLNSVADLANAEKTSLASHASRLFFPHGIHSIHLQLKLDNAVEVHVNVSGIVSPPSWMPFSHVMNVGPQDIIDSCERHWEQFKSDCSGFVKAVAADFAITLTGQADDIVDQINSGDWQKAADGPAAQRQAEAGCFVVAGLKGADHNPPRDHGHVVVVVNGPLAHDKYPSAYWGTLGGVGKKNTTLNYAWNTADRDNIIYRYRVLA